MPSETQAAGPAPKGGDLIRRHRLSTRIWHWLNAVTLLVMLMSGLMIFNAHPRLYWGQYGANNDPGWLEIGSTNGGRGVLLIGSRSFDTTGVLGLSTGANGQPVEVAFPGWATVPSTYDLALARRRHLTFAWLLSASIVAYLLWSLVNGHLRRDLAPKGRELRPGHIFHEIAQHARLRLPKGEAARHYNTLQKFSYLAVILVLIPLMVLTGLTMSPQMDAAWPWLLDVFGGRQSARSIHFITAWLLVGFVIVHLLMVLLAGPLNEIRSMITGWFRLPKERAR